MSTDYVGNFFASVSKKILNKFSKIENISFCRSLSSDWSDDVIDGWSRETVFIETKENNYFYVLDTSLFSGFVSSDRVVVANKDNSDKKTFKLTVKEKYKDSSFIKNKENWSKLNLSDFELYNDYCCFDVNEYDFDEDNHVFKAKEKFVKLPCAFISNDNDNFIVEATFNKHLYYIIFNITESGLLEVSYYNTKSYEMLKLALEDVLESEYMDAFVKANEVSIIKYNYKHSDIYYFPIYIELNFNKIKNESMPNLSEEEKAKIDHLESLCYDGMRPIIPKLPLAEFNNNTLTFNGPYDKITKYLVHYVLQGLNLPTLFSLGLDPFDDLSVLEQYKIKKIIIPGNVKNIYERAFMDQEFSLIEIQEGVETIQKEAFINTGTMSILLPNSLKEIGIKAFGNSNIKKIIIPKNVSSLSMDAFKYCFHLKEIKIDSNNPFYRSFNNNVVIENKTNKLIFALKNAVIPEDVKITDE